MRNLEALIYNSVSSNLTMICDSYFTKQFSTGTYPNIITDNRDISRVDFAPPL